MTIRTAMLCDICDSVFVAPEQSLRQRLTIEAHAPGWTSTYRGGHWSNECPEHSVDHA